MRFFSRGRTIKTMCFARRSVDSQRGYVLISAIALAVLYFALMELMMIDSSRALREAQRFRSRIISSTLAESAAELAAAKMVSTGMSNTAKATDEQGSMDGTLKLANAQFELVGDAKSAGVMPMKSSVRVQGRIEGTRVIIDYTFHSQ
ncbi:MAG: hypothetical protein QOE68_594 [Thermoanaerobaculia bacterium]|nr:hypothetical protein [Thermoanaerobaculia bacterium]